MIQKATSFSTNTISAIFTPLITFARQVVMEAINKKSNYSMSKQFNFNIHSKKLNKKQNSNVHGISLKNMMI